MRWVAGLSIIVIFTGLAWKGSKTGDTELTLPQIKSSNIELNFPSANAVKDPSDFLSLYVGRKAECCDNKKPMAGRFSVNGNTLIFNPAFDLIEGQTYTVLSRNKVSGVFEAPKLTEFTLTKAAPYEVPEIISIYPSGDIIPENTLRFHIDFSVPMKPHVSKEFIKLVDTNGQVDPAAFMNFKQELWSEDRKRLTLLIDPGRVKRGVAQNLSLGPALLEGETYSIVVEPGWPSANGMVKAPRFEKLYHVSSAFRTLPDPRLWIITPPRTHSRDPLKIKLNRIFDYQSLQNRLTITDANAKTISGQVSIKYGETVWQFDPFEPWSDNLIQIIIDSRLEDVTGNNLNELLDHTAESNHISDTRKMVLDIQPLSLSPTPNNMK